jgi:hypothetical protein
MRIHRPTESEILIRSDKKIEALEQQARDLARSVEMVRQQTLAQSNERIEAPDQKVRDLARFVESTRQQTLLQSDKKTERSGRFRRDLAKPNILAIHDGNRGARKTSAGFGPFR